LFGSQPISKARSNGMNLQAENSAKADFLAVIFRRENSSQ
jgi:hypothetical protein